MLDFHNHLIPDVDDGSPDLERSMEAIRLMSAQGVDGIITTPHLRASALSHENESSEYLARVDRSWKDLSLRAQSEFPQTRLARGFEILLDAPSLKLVEPVLRLAGSRFALVEFLFLSIPPHSDYALFNIRIDGYEPIVAHPERYRDVQGDPTRVEKWLHVGAHLQANAGSFLGKYGPEAESVAWQLLEKGALSYVCSDYHAIGTCDSLEAYEQIAARYGRECAESLFVVNPNRILHDKAPNPVKPVRRMSRRLVERFRFFRKR